MTRTGYTLDDYTRGRLTLRALASFVFCLGADSRTAAALTDDGGEASLWAGSSLTQELLAEIADRLAGLQWSLASIFSKSKLKEPEPIARPSVKKREKQGTQTIKGDVTTVAELEKFFEEVIANG